MGGITPRGCVDLRTGDPGLDDCGGGGRWTAGRAICGSVIRAILLGGPDRERGAVAALRVAGARITGRLDLAHAEVSCPVRLEQCWFEEAPDLRGGEVRHLDFSRSWLPGLIADDQAVAGHMVLAGCRLAEAAGSLSPGCVLSALRLTVSRNLLMNGGFTAEGEGSLADARVGNVLDFSGARIRNHGATALEASRLSVEGPVLCRDGFAADGEVVLRRARIGGFLDFSGARLSDPGGCALRAPVLTVGAGFLCRDGTVFTGAVRLAGGHISGELDLSGAVLDNPGRTALEAARLTVEGPVFCRDGFAASGQVILRNAHIAGFLCFRNARLSDPGGQALLAPGLTADGVTFSDGTVIDGQVTLDTAHLAGGLDLSGATFSGSQETTLNCASLSAPDLQMPRDPLPGAADLSRAQIGVLTAPPGSTPAGVRVSGLTYDTLLPLLPARQRLRWLASGHQGYLPSPTSSSPPATGGSATTPTPAPSCSPGSAGTTRPCPSPSGHGDASRTPPPDTATGRAAPRCG
jgi:hypothetical protein